ncbi:DUF6114 domain-containing protein [Antrihabitans stalactiti]|uniref:DUF6114 domain-containing protein n=1 Tax=Antrihabitans stalactiti TaxID=2584121 RepID=UPI0019808BE5|nr:DUF6114 domain-containing protein [Antrihabitans stalactiti]
MLIARERLRLALHWFRGFRRSRPFWGGLWMIVGGWAILKLSLVGLQLMFSAGLTGFGGWLSGGGLILCGIAAWLAPSQRFFAGLIGLLLAVVSFVISNLGGLFVGMFFGIVGSAMVLCWGPTKRRKRRAAEATESTPSDELADATAGAPKPSESSA